MTLPSQNHPIVLHMDPDERLAAAAGGAVRHFGDAVGLEAEATVELQSSVLAACRFCFKLQPTAARFQVLFQRLSDRIQIELSFPGNDSHLDQVQTAFPGVDEVQAQPSLLRLTKLIPASSASA
jgi:hypothetical protein